MIQEVKDSLRALKNMTFLSYNELRKEEERKYIYI